MVCALVVPAVALAATVDVRGTRGNDTVSIEAESQDRANVILNGQMVASVSDGDTLALQTGPGNDSLIDIRDTTDPAFALRAAFGAGADQLSVSATDACDPTLSPHIRAAGGPGADRLSISSSVCIDDTSAPNVVVRGDLGADQISLGGTFEAPGLVRLEGGSDNDVLRLTDSVGNTSTAGSDASVSGGGGSDTIVTRGDGRDKLFGGVARDFLTARGEGPDKVYGNLGNDMIRVRGGGRDRVSCDGVSSGGGTNDVVIADSRDVVAPDCETVKRG